MKNLPIIIGSFIAGAAIVWIFKNQDVLQLVNSRTVHNHGGTSESNFVLRGPLRSILD